MTGSDRALNAFVLRHRRPYWRYAASRMGRTSFAQQVVDRVMVRLAADWPRLVRERNLSAAAWALVREEVSARCDGPHGLREADALHRLLPSAAADAAVLHYQLGMQLTEAADLMGVEPSTAAGLVLAAERSLPKVGGERLAFRSTGA